MTADPPVYNYWAEAIELLRIVSNHERVMDSELTGRTAARIRALLRKVDADA